MASGMGEHGIAQAVLAVEPAKEQSKTAIEQEAPKDDQRCKFSKELHHSRKMSRSEQQRGNHVRCHDHTGRSLRFPAIK